MSLIVSCRKIQMLENDIKDLKTQARSVKLKKTTDMKIRELQRKIDELSGTISLSDI